MVLWKEGKETVGGGWGWGEFPNKVDGTDSALTHMHAPRTVSQLLSDAFSSHGLWRDSREASLWTSATAGFRSSWLYWFSFAA